MNSIKKFLNKKNILILITIVIIIILFLVLYFSILKNNYLKRLMNTNDIDNLKIANLITNDNNVIASKYVFNNYTLKQTSEAVELNDLEGHVLYLRSDKTDANIYQVKKYMKDTKDPIIIEIDQSIKLFENDILETFKIKDKDFINDKIYGKIKTENVRIEENIFKDLVQYTRTYKSDNVIYDFNYYMIDDYLYCEFVKILD